MATAHDTEQLIVSSIDKGENSSSEINIVREPLLEGEHHAENYSVLSAVLPFLFPAFGGLLYGYDIGATSSATISIESATLSGISWYDLSSVQTGLITSGSLYGALIGSAVAFQIADWLGRRRELIVSALFYFLGALVTAFAPVYVILVIGRLLYGVGIGLAMHAAPMYIAETAPSQIRGQLISLKEFFIVFGMLAGYTVGSLLIETVAGWRYMYGISAPLAVIMGIGMWWLPSSPRWILLCAMQGKGELQGLRENAICCLCQLRGAAIGDSASRQVDDILSELSQLSEEKEATIGEMLQGKCLKALTIGAGLILFQQITGQPSVLYYAAKIFQDAGFSAAADATRASVFLALLKLIMTAVAVVVVDKLGRRPLLLGGVSGIAMSLFLLGSYYTFLGDVPAVAVTALLLYVGCYQLSFGPIGWLMISEIFPLRVRGRGLSITVLVNFGANALVAFAFSPLQNRACGPGSVHLTLNRWFNLNIKWQRETELGFKKKRYRIMAKFNEVQKKRRAIISESKRARHGDPNTRKLKQKVQPLAISGKRKRKLFKKWRREQKEAVEKGVITMEDVEMAVADAAEGKTQDSNKAHVKFPMKKSSKLKMKQLKKKGKSKRKSVKQATESSTDAMME